MKVGLFGGSFDPIHRGHVEPVQAARRSLGLERVVYLPTARPPHKGDRRLAPPLARYAMVEMALLAEEGLFASSHELTPDRPAYTVETLEHFRRLRPDWDLHLLLGSDSLAGLSTWRRYRDILGLARLVVLARPGWDPELIRRDLPPELAALWGGPREPRVVEGGVEASSSDLRERLARGTEPSPGLLHPQVLDYIQKYDLYR